jgi:hypothetical protein
LQKSEESAEYIAASEYQNRTLRLYRVLSKQERRRNQVAQAQDGLKDRNKRVNPTQLHVGEWRRSHDPGEEKYYGGKRSPALPLVDRQGGDHKGKIAIGTLK